MKTFKILLASASAATLAFALPAFGAVGANLGVSAKASTSANVSVNVEARISLAKDRANQEIDRRIQGLTDLESKVSSMNHVTDAGKAQLNATVDAQIADLQALKTKIEADTDIDTLKTDVQSITKSYRIYALVIPQGRILVAADKVGTVDGLMAELGSKLEARINEAATAGADTASMNALLQDLSDKIQDADASAAASVNTVAVLVPDNGDNTVFQSNKKALSDARADLRKAHDDLVAARKDAQQIINALNDLGLDANLKANVNATSTATST